MHKNTDLIGCEINEGDWLVRAYNLGRCAALKFAKVENIDGPKIRTIGFSPTNFWDESGAKFMTDRAYGNVMYPDRTFVVSTHCVPEEILNLYSNWKKEKSLG